MTRPPGGRRRGRADRIFPIASFSVLASSFRVHVAKGYEGGSGLVEVWFRPCGESGMGLDDLAVRAVQSRTMAVTIIIDSLLEACCLCHCWLIYKLRRTCGAPRPCKNPAWLHRLNAVLCAPRAWRALRRRLRADLLSLV